MMTSNEHQSVSQTGHEIPAAGNPDLPAEGQVNVVGDLESLRSTGPQDAVMESLFPSQGNPPATDVSTQPFFWSSFNISPKRVQRGGWAREVTGSDFHLSKEIAGVNMHLAPGGIRELHWHQTAEWGIMTRGWCRVTTVDQYGRPSVEDVEEGDLWYFPAGIPHSLQGLGPTGAEFVLAFDGGEQSESNTLLVTDFFAHVPLEVLAKNFGLPAETFRDMPLHNLWIFQGEEPGDLRSDQLSVEAEPKDEPVIFRLSRSEPVRKNSGGQIQIADSSNFKASKTVAAALVTVEPGGMREMHWHPNADEWQYYLQGKGRMTVFDTGPKATTNDFQAGDIGLVKRNLGHYVENVGDTVLKFVEIFRAPHYEEISLAEWLSRTPPSLVMQHFNLSADQVARLPKGRRGIVPL